MSIKTGQFIKLYNYIKNYIKLCVKSYNICFFFYYRQQRPFGTQSKIYGGVLDRKVNS